jgi:signal peptidase I
MDKAKKHKILNNVVTGVLGAFIVFLLGCQVSMLVTSNNNYGVPSLFGYSFMRVLTDSMKGTASDSFDTGSGVIMKKVSAEAISPNDIITFYSPTLSEQAGGRMVVSHRVYEIIETPEEASGTFTVKVSDRETYSLDGGTTYLTPTSTAITLKNGDKITVKRNDYPTTSLLSYTMDYSSDNAGAYTFFTCGDNLAASTCKYTQGGVCTPAYRDSVAEKYFIGQVISHNDGFGSFLNVVQQDWFIPVTVLIPLSAIAVMSAIDLVKATKKEQAEENATIEKAMKEAGVDPTDEKQVLLFTEKERYRLEIQKELEKAKEEERKRLGKEMKKKPSKDDKMEDKS